MWNRIANITSTLHFISDREQKTEYKWSDLPTPILLSEISPLSFPTKFDILSPFTVFQYFIYCLSIYLYYCYNYVVIKYFLFRTTSCFCMIIDNFCLPCNTYLFVTLNIRCYPCGKGFVTHWVFPSTYTWLKSIRAPI